MLAARGATPDVVEDVLQDTALKLLQNWDRVDPDLPLWPLAKTAAVNCFIDRHRGASAVYLADLPDYPAPYDTEERGLARAKLSRVRAALTTLGPADRSVLLAEVGVSPRRTNCSATKMARKRARIRLANALNRVGTAFGGLHLGWRRVATWGQSQLSVELQPLVPAATGTIAALSMALALTVPEPERVLPSRDLPRVAAATPTTSARVNSRDFSRRVVHKPRRTDRVATASGIASEETAEPQSKRTRTQAEETTVENEAYRLGSQKRSFVCGGRETDVAKFD